MLRTSKTRRRTLSKTVCLFTFKRDQSIALETIINIQMWFPEMSIKILDDSKNPVDKEYIDKFLSMGCRYKATTFKRNCNLNGKEACVSILSELIAAGEEDSSSMVFKCDSDFLMFSPKIRDGIESFWRENGRAPSAAFFRTVNKHKDQQDFVTGYGLFYGLSLETAIAVRDKIDNEEVEYSEFLNKALPEDKTITSATVGEVGIDSCVVINRPASCCAWIGAKNIKFPQKYLGMGVVHFGERKKADYNEMKKGMVVANSFLLEDFAIKNGYPTN